MKSTLAIFAGPFLEGRLFFVHWTDLTMQDSLGCAQNKGFQVNAFTSYEAAIKWLIEEESDPHNGSGTMCFAHGSTRCHDGMSVVARVHEKGNSMLRGFHPNRWRCCADGFSYLAQSRPSS
jgi:hypothetical protein